MVYMYPGQKMFDFLQTKHFHQKLVDVFMDRENAWLTYEEVEDCMQWKKFEYRMKVCVLRHMCVCVYLLYAHHCSILLHVLSCLCVFDYERLVPTY